MNDALRVHCGSRGYTLSRFINVNNISIYGTKKMKSEECYHSPTIFYPKAVYRSVAHINVILIYSFMGVFREELDLNDNLKTIKQCLFVTLIRYHKLKSHLHFFPIGTVSWLEGRGMGGGYKEFVEQMYCTFGICTCAQRDSQEFPQKFKLENS